MNYKLILFDADGTLYDFTRAEREAFEKTLRQFGIHENLSYLHKEYKKINLAIWKEFEEKTITSTKLRLERFSRFFKQEKRCRLSSIDSIFNPGYYEEEAV